MGYEVDIKTWRPQISIVVKSSNQVANIMVKKTLNDEKVF